MDIQEFLRRNTSVSKCEISSPKSTSNSKSVQYLDKKIVWNQFPSTFKLRTKRPTLGEPESTMLTTSSVSSIPLERTSVRSRPYSGRRSSLILAPLENPKPSRSDTVTFSNQNEVSDNQQSTRPNSAVSVVSMGCHNSAKRSNHIQSRNNGFPARGFYKSYRHLDRNISTPSSQKQDELFDVLFQPDKDTNESDELNDIYNSLTTNVNAVRSGSPAERHFTTPLGHLPLKAVKMRSRGQHDSKNASASNGYGTHLLSAAQERAALEAKQAKLRERQEVNAVYVPKTKTRLLRIFTGSTVDNERMCRRRIKPVQFLHLQTPITIHTNAQAKSPEIFANPPLTYSTNFFTSPTIMYNSSIASNHRMHNCYKCREMRAASRHVNVIKATS